MPNKNVEYRRYVSVMPCAVVGCATSWPADPHHVRSRGAGGGDEGNLIPLCRNHHESWHRIGRHSFARQFRLRSPFVELGNRDKCFPPAVLAVKLWEQYAREHSSPLPF